MHELLAVHPGQFVIDHHEVEAALLGGGEGIDRMLVGGDGIAGLAEEQALHFAKNGRVLDNEDVRAGGSFAVVSHQQRVVPGGPTWMHWHRLWANECLSFDLVIGIVGGTILIIIVLPRIRISAETGRAVLRSP